MRYLASICTLLLGFSPAHADDLDRLSAQVAPSVLKVRVVKDTSRRLATGSAVVVAPGKLITSCHGTRDSRAIDVLAQGRRWLVEAQWKDIDHDLCLLQVESEIAPALTLAPSDAAPRVGDAVVAVGFEGPLIRVSDGTVRALHPYDAANVIQTDATFHGGESGGALVNQRGELVGVLTFFAHGKRDYFFAVPVAWVQALLQRAASGTGPVSQPRIAFWERLGEQQPRFLLAAAYEYAQDWPGLIDTASGWTRDEATNPEAWIALGKGFHHAQRGAAAIEALQQALRLNPDHPTGWYYLGAAYQQVDDTLGLALALERLEALSPKAADALRQGPEAGW